MSDSNAPLWVEITYPIANPDAFTHQGTIKNERLSDILCEFLRSQMGAGVDPSPANGVEVYNIRLELDLSFDTFKVSSNCGNKGLRDGILYDVTARLSKKYPEG